MSDTDGQRHLGRRQGRVEGGDGQEVDVGGRGRDRGGGQCRGAVNLDKLTCDYLGWCWSGISQRKS